MNPRLTSASAPHPTHLPTSMIKNALRRLQGAVDAYLIIEVGVGGSESGPKSDAGRSGSRREASGSRREAESSQRDLATWESLIEPLRR
jgi:hypothetical protein